MEMDNMQRKLLINFAFTVLILLCHPPNPCSVSMRVAAYAVPVVVLSVAVNIPKFLETRVVTERTQDPHTGQNVTNYSFDVTELRWAGWGRQCKLTRILARPIQTRACFRVEEPYGK